jgi:hypothetical protein
MPTVEDGISPFLPNDFCYFVGTLVPLLYSCGILAVSLIGITWLNFIVHAYTLNLKISETKTKAMKIQGKCWQRKVINNQIN